MIRVAGEKMAFSGGPALAEGGEALHVHEETGPAPLVVGQLVLAPRHALAHLEPHLVGGVAVDDLVLALEPLAVLVGLAREPCHEALDRIERVLALGEESPEAPSLVTRCGALPARPPGDDGA
jgi:hypothetical protein